MGAFENLFRRLGYAKLDKYGLVLTGDDRVLTTRPHILDDGLGGKIVGWSDGDLAAMELEHWGVPKQPKLDPAKRVAGKKVIQPPPRPPARPTLQTPVIVAAPAPVAPVAAVVVAPAPVVAPVVAPDEPVEDDDWEWVIAIARARATAEETPLVAAPAKRRTNPGMAAVRAHTEPQPVVRSMPKPVAPLARKTVIPVPQLDQSPLRRIARGTGQLDDTVRTLPAPPANDDTSPYVTLPAEVRPVGHAHTKRVAAKAR